MHARCTSHAIGIGIPATLLRSFESSTKANAAQADIVDYGFDLSKHLNEAVAKVRRKENKALQRLDDDSLNGTKQLWLFAPKKISRKLRKASNDLMTLGLAQGMPGPSRGHRGSTGMTNARDRPGSVSSGGTSGLFRSRLKPIVEVAKWMKRHLEGLSNFIGHKVTNAMKVGFDSKVQNLKLSARGLRSFGSYRRRILFYCGNLDSMP